MMIYKRSLSARLLAGITRNGFSIEKKSEGVVSSVEITDDELDGLVALLEKLREKRREIETNRRALPDNALLGIRVHYAGYIMDFEGVEVVTDIAGSTIDDLLPCIRDANRIVVEANDNSIWTHYVKSDESNTCG
jgi:hypothetical protein